MLIFFSNLAQFHAQFMLIFSQIQLSHAQSMLIFSQIQLSHAYFMLIYGVQCSCHFFSYNPGFATFQIYLLSSSPSTTFILLFSQMDKNDQCLVIICCYPLILYNRGLIFKDIDYIYIFVGYECVDISELKICLGIHIQ